MNGFEFFSLDYDNPTELSEPSIVESWDKFLKESALEDDTWAGEYKDDQGNLTTYSLDDDESAEVRETLKKAGYNPSDWRAIDGGSFMVFFREKEVFQPS